jgi:hypothetical protein
MSKGGRMSNRLFNTQTANTRESSSKKIGHYGRGQNDAPTPVKAGAVTTKGNAPSSMGKESGGTPFKCAEGNISGTAQGMGAAKKGGKYTWI